MAVLGSRRGAFVYIACTARREPHATGRLAEQAQQGVFGPSQRGVDNEWQTGTGVR